MPMNILISNKGKVKVSCTDMTRFVYVLELLTLFHKLHCQAGTVRAHE